MLVVGIPVNGAKMLPLGPPRRSLSMLLLWRDSAERLLFRLSPRPLSKVTRVSGSAVRSIPLDLDLRGLLEILGFKGPLAKGLYLVEERLVKVRKRGRRVAREPAVIEKPISMEDQIAIFGLSVAFRGVEVVIGLLGWLSLIHDGWLVYYKSIVKQVRWNVIHRKPRLCIFVIKGIRMMMATLALYILSAKEWQGWRYQWVEKEDTHMHASPRRLAAAIFVFRFICRPRTRIIGSTPTVISNTAEVTLKTYSMIPIVLTALHFPSVSPSICVHQKETGEHCTTIRMKKTTPLVTASAVAPYNTFLCNGDTITRRRDMHTDVLARIDEMA